MVMLYFLSRATAIPKIAPTRDQAVSAVKARPGENQNSAPARTVHLSVGRGWRLKFAADFNLGHNNTPSTSVVTCSLGDGAGAIFMISQKNHFHDARRTLVTLVVLNILLSCRILELHLFDYQGFQAYHAILSVA
jgi:hypothetical protein